MADDRRAAGHPAVHVRAEPASALAEHARVPIAFHVRERLVVRAPDGGLGGLPLVLEPVVPPYVKDYDADASEHPVAWAARADAARWALLGAFVGAARVGGAVVARADDGASAAARADVAVLRDLRVAPAWRGQGVGAALFRAAEAWARARGAAWLEVETQNVNVPACRFYARQGCVLGAVHRLAYPSLPDEVQLLWYRALRGGAGVP